MEDLKQWGMDILSRVELRWEKKCLPFIILMEGGKGCLWLRLVEIVNSGKAVPPGLVRGHVLLIYSARVLTHVIRVQVKF